MAHIVVLGAGLGGTIAAYQLRDQLGTEHEGSVVGKGETYSFVPSNPWVAVGWRDRASVEVDLVPVFRSRNITFHPQGTSRLHPAERRIEFPSRKYRRVMSIGLQAAHGFTRPRSDSKKYYLHEMRTGTPESIYERLALHALGMEKLKEINIENTQTTAPKLRSCLTIGVTQMTLDRSILAFAGIMVLLSVALTVWVSPYLVWLTVFVGANMLQSAFTGFCPAAIALRKLGIKPGAAF